MQFPPANCVPLMATTVPQATWSSFAFETLDLFKTAAQAE